MSRLSIIMPVYNEQAHLEYCVESILRQKYTDFELILVDDGSTDCSPEICDKYKEKDSRITVIHQNNQGIIKARVNGTVNSTGEFITFADADDWIDEEMYADLMQIMEEENVDMVISGIYRYYNERKILADGQLLREGRYTREDIEKEVIPYMLWGAKKNTWELDPSLWSKIFKRELVLKHLINAGELGIDYGEDTSVIYPLVLDLKSMYVTHNKYYFHRQREVGNIPYYFTDEMFFEKLYKTYRYLKEKFANNKYEEVLQRQLDYFYMKSVQHKRKCYLDITEKQEDIFPYIEVTKDSNVILYGAGEVGCRYMKQNEKYHFCNIIVWVDKCYEKYRKQGKSVYGIEMIQKTKYDYIIIAVKSAELAKQIEVDLINKGVDRKKIIWNATMIQSFVERT